MEVVQEIKNSFTICTYFKISVMHPIVLSSFTRKNFCPLLNIWFIQSFLWKYCYFPLNMAIFTFNFCFKTCEYFVLQGCSNFENRFHSLLLKLSTYPPAVHPGMPAAIPTGILCPGPGLVPHPCTLHLWTIPSPDVHPGLTSLWTQLAVPGAWACIPTDC